MMSCNADSSTELKLSWEWPAGRTAQSILLVQVDSIKKQGRGWFGVGNSPGLVENLPEATVLRGHIAAGQQKGRSVLLVLPGPEIPPDITAQSLVALQMVSDLVCTGIAKQPQ